MSGVYSSVRQKTSFKIANAPFVRCCAHNLNLVISDTAESTQVTNNNFTTLQSVFNLFSSSIIRWKSLAFNEETAKQIRLKMLKKLCPTRWEDRHASVTTLKERRIGVVKSLTHLCLLNMKTDEKLSFF